METREHKIKRLTMRSMRRGLQEMDLILMQKVKKCMPQATTHACHVDMYA